MLTNAAFDASYREYLNRKIRARRRTYSNADVVQAIRQLADNLDEPGADEWDGAGVVRTIGPAVMDLLTDGTWETDDHDRP